MMFRYEFLAFLVLFVVRSFCDQDFKSLDHRAWRCKEKLNTAENTEHDTNNRSNLPKSTLPIAIDKHTEISNKQLRCDMTIT